MALFRDLMRSLSNGSGTVEKLERAIDELQRRHDAAITELDRLPERRKALLLADDQPGLAKLRGDHLRLEDERDGAAAALEHIRSQLVIARDKAREARWGTHAAAYDRALAGYMPAARTALEKFIALAAARDAAIKDGFGTELQTRRAPPNVNGNPLLAPDLLDAFEQELERVLRAPPKVIAPLTSKPAPATSPKPERTDTQTGAPDQAPVRKKRDARRDEPKVGDVLVEILRSGVEIGEFQFAVGDRVSLSPEVAERLVRAGAADFVPMGQGQPLPASNSPVSSEISG
jgi:hypothetical protein